MSNDQPPLTDWHTFVPPHPRLPEDAALGHRRVARCAPIDASKLGAAVGPRSCRCRRGGEWLAGPLTTARYGGAILWLSTVSILAQVFYNLEISRYTLYCGEPIFTRKFRLLPGPMFWLVLYCFLDFGSVFPYLIANAATPLAAVMLGETPNIERTYNIGGILLDGKTLLQYWTYVVFLLVLVPLVVGGKVYNSLKAVMTFKIIVVFGFLLIVAAAYSSQSTWTEIFSGFLKFGSVPVTTRDTNSLPVMDNLFVAWWQDRDLPKIDFTMIAT